MTHTPTKTSLDYLAVIHVTGEMPKGMHKKTNTSLAVYLNTSLEVPTLLWRVSQQAVSMILTHPLVVSFEKLAEEGYVFDKERTRNRWTISKGVPMKHTADLRAARIFLGGKVLQYEGGSDYGRWRREASEGLAS